jgi:L-xylulose reductase
VIDFNHRPVLVTGATGGIGGETVRQLMTAGADVIASGPTEEALKAFAETGVRTLAFDVTSEDSVRDALEGLDLYGVVNCAGLGGEIATPMDTDIAIALSSVIGTTFPKASVAATTRLTLPAISVSCRA